MFKGIEYLGPVGVGVTSPQLFRADNGNVYVVKLQNNRLGKKALANELLAAQIGELMGLCFPPSGIIELSEPVLLSSKRLKVAGVKPGRHFACLYLKGSSYVGKTKLKKAVNKAEIAGVMLFDHMFHNIDRTWNRKNMLIRKENGVYKIYAIDHSHLFRRGRWTISWLERISDRIEINTRRTYGLLLKYYLRPAHFIPYVGKVKAIQDEDFKRMIDNIPNEWLPDEAERMALLQFLIKRRKRIPDIAATLCHLIPDVHRSSHPYQNI